MESTSKGSLAMDRYPVFFEKTFLSEGYFQDSSQDKGNYYEGKLYGTICGITARNHFREFSVALDIYRTKKLELLKDYCMRFYAKKGYWNPLYEDIDDSSLAFKIWDFGVNAGVERAVKILQKVLITHYSYNIENDGVLGPTTLRCINEAYEKPENVNLKIKMVDGESNLYAYYVHYIEQHYRLLNKFWLFGKGWLRRLWDVFNQPPNKTKGLIFKPKNIEEID